MPSIDASTLRELLHYDPETGIFTWKPRDRKWSKSYCAHRAWNAKHPGDRAGWVKRYKSLEYRSRTIKLLGKYYNEHRLVWLYMTGEEPAGCIDHINRDATDNRWRNLKLSSHQENATNRSMQANNTSGICGVSWHKATSRWQATCKIKGKSFYLGLHDTRDAASEAVMEFRRKHGFTDGHGEEAPYRTSA